MIILLLFFMKNQLHLGAKWLFRFRTYRLFMALIFFILWIVFVVAVSLNINIWGMILGYIVIAILLGEIYSRMAYVRWFYEFTLTEVRLERGIIWKKYSNIPYERIQNVDVTRGIIARIFGFSTVNIQTAGYSMPMGRWGNLHSSEGFIPAIDIKKAEEIRKFVMKKISKRRGLGL